MGESTTVCFGEKKVPLFLSLVREKKTERRGERTHTHTLLSTLAIAIAG